MTEKHKHQWIIWNLTPDGDLTKPTTRASIKFVCTKLECAATARVEIEFSKDLKRVEIKEVKIKEV